MKRIEMVKQCLEKGLIKPLDVPAASDDKLRNLLGILKEMPIYCFEGQAHRRTPIESEIDAEDFIRRN